MKTHPGGRLFLSAAALGVAAVFATALVVVTIWAGFSPTHHVELSDNFCGVNADITTSFSAPGTDLNYAKFFAFTPVEFFPDEPVPIGAKAGRIAATLTLGLLNGSCSASLSPSFDLYWASTDPSCLIPFGDQFTDGDGNGLHDGIDCYPDFLERMFPGLTPVERQYGDASTSGQNVSINIVVFEAGDLPGFPAVWGRPSVIVLNNLGDPASVPTPGEVITDVCTPLWTVHKKFGLSQDNPATPGDEAGYEVRRNPPYGGTYIFPWYAESMRDADGDGIENCIDTCPFDPNVDNPPKLDVGPDFDGIDSSCESSMRPQVWDPTQPCWPGAPGVFNDCDGDFFYNRGDNCPFVANQDQADADGDCIGDACDLPGAGGIGKGPNTPDGEPIVVTPQDDVEVVGCPPDCRAGVDTDGDHFFNNNVECYVGTDPLDACPDGPTDDAWPPDIQAARGCGFHDGRVDILDVLCYKPKLTGPYDNRYDLDTNGAVEILDVLLYKPVMKTFCTNP